MKFLIIWQTIPEKTELFILNTVVTTEIKLIRKAHEKYINSDDDTEGVDWIYEHIEGKESLDADTGLGIVLKGEHEIIITGFVL